MTDLLIDPEFFFNPYVNVHIVHIAKGRALLGGKVAPGQFNFFYIEVDI